MSVQGRWVDQTSYYRGEEKIPRVWALDTGELKIIVHRHINSPGSWYVSCRALEIDIMKLDAETSEDAQKEGVEFIYNDLTNKLSSIVPFRDSI